ncbi:MAG: HPr family phosphocarrier protein [Candidatus Omnitrophica bacterium]|nr:HPr family phosphocarrier protein [Candidatus Omnitrophota bacterium]
MAMPSLQNPMIEGYRVQLGTKNSAMRVEDYLKKAKEMFDSLKTETFLQEEIRQHMQFEQGDRIGQATAWFEGLEMVENKIPSNLVFAPILFDVSNRSEKSVKARELVPWLNQTLKSHFPNLQFQEFSPDDIVVVKKPLNEELGRSFRALHKFAVDERVLDNPALTKWIMVHEAIHVLFPGFLQANYLNEAVTELITDKIMGGHGGEESLYLDRLMFLKMILNTDKTGEMMKALIQSYQTGDISLLRERIIQLKGGDNLFFLLVHLELFEIFGELVWGHFTSLSLYKFLRLYSHLIKKYNEKVLAGDSGEALSLWHLIRKMQEAIQVIIKNKAFYVNLGRVFSVSDVLSWESINIDFSKIGINPDEFDWSKDHAQTVAADKIASRDSHLNRDRKNTHLHGPYYSWVNEIYTHRPELMTLGIYRDQAMMGGYSLEHLIWFIDNAGGNGYHAEALAAFDEIKSRGVETFSHILRHQLGDSYLQLRVADLLCRSPNAKAYYNLIKSWAQNNNMIEMYIGRLIALAPTEEEAQQLFNKYYALSSQENIKYQLRKGVNERHLIISDSQRLELNEYTMIMKVNHGGGLHFRVAAKLISRILKVHPECRVIFEKDGKRVEPVEGDYTISQIVNLGVSEADSITIHVQSNDYDLGRSLAFNIRNYLMDLKEDFAMSSTGGIDLTAPQTPLEVQHSGPGIKLQFNRPQLAAIKEAGGFKPIVTGWHSLESLQEFLEKP